MYITVAFQKYKLGFCNEYRYMSIWEIRINISRIFSKKFYCFIMKLCKYNYMIIWQIFANGIIR